MLAKLWLQVGSLSWLMDGCGPGRGAKHPYRGEICVKMRIGLTTSEYDARKWRPEERSTPVSCMKSQGIDFSREGGGR